MSQSGRLCVREREERYLERLVTRVSLEFDPVDDGTFALFSSSSEFDRDCETLCLIGGL